MKTMIDFDGMATAVENTKKFVADTMTAHNSDANAHSDTFVQKVTGKGLSTNDFTDELKTKLEGLSSVTSGGMSFFIGTTQPEDTNTIWFDTTGYE